MEKMLVLLLFLGLVATVKAATYEYKLTATEFNQTAPNEMVFSIYLENTGSDQIDYWNTQAILNVNPEFSNGGILSVEVIETISPHVTPLPSVINGSIISATCKYLHYGIGGNERHFLMKLRLSTTALQFSGNPGFSWRDRPATNPVTKIFKYVDGLIKEFTAQSNYSSYHLIDSKTGVNEPNLTVNDFKLFQNYPNPFNPKTTIEFEIQKKGLVKLVIYDMLGRMVDVLINEEMLPGLHRQTFDGRNLPSSGNYIYKLTIGKNSETKKLTLIK